MGRGLMKYSIDRFEGECAVLEKEDGTFLNVLHKFLPENAREGDLIQWDGTVWVVCTEQTMSRREALLAYRRKLLEGNS